MNLSRTTHFEPVGFGEPDHLIGFIQRELDAYPYLFAKSGKSVYVPTFARSQLVNILCTGKLYMYK